MTERELNERLERLEKDNRRLKRVGMVAVLIAAGLGAIAATRPTPERITAHEVDIVGSRGNTRIILSASSNSPSIALVDAQGKPRAAVIVSTDGMASISITDAQGHPSVLMGEGSLTLSDAQGHPGVGMDVEADGSALVTVGPPGTGAAMNFKDGLSAVTLGDVGVAGHSWVRMSEDAGNPRIEVADRFGYSAEIGSFPFTPHGTTVPLRPGAATIALYAASLPVWIRSATLPAMQALPGLPPLP
jgi:hypothetical protein